MSFRNVSSSSVCLKNLWIIDIESSLNIWYNSPVKSSVSGIFFVVRFFITNSISSPHTCYLNLGCYNTSSWDWCYLWIFHMDGLNNKLLFLIVLKAESKIRVPACLMSWWDHSSWLADDFLFYPHMEEAEREEASPLIEIRTLIPFMRTPLYDHLWKALPPDTITLGGRISTYNFGEDTNIQSKALTFNMITDIKGLLFSVFLLCFLFLIPSITAFFVS